MRKLIEQKTKARWKRLKKEALEHVAKQEQFDFPIDYTSIKRIYSMAGKKQKPVGIMIREWVLERLMQEETNTSTPELNQSKTLNELLKSIKSLKADLAKITNKNTKRKQKTTRIA